MHRILPAPSARSARTRLGIHFIQAALTLCLATLILWASVAGRRSQTQEAAPVGRFTGHQAIERAAPLFWKLLSASSSLTLESDPAVAAMGGSRVEKRWTVYCLNGRGQELAVVNFDANTGRLRSASMVLRRQSNAPLRTTRMEAAHTAKQWLTSLGPEEGLTQWVVREILRTSNSWSIQLRNGSRRAIAMIDTTSGKLCSVILSP